MRFTINYNSIRTFRPLIKVALERKRKALSQAIRDSTLALYSEAVKQTPVKTGRLQKHRYSIKRYEGRIYPTVSYAYWVHEGTGIHGPTKKPYTITPTRKRALRFKVGGQWVFAKSVTHPGQKANPFYKRAIMAQEKYVTDRLNKVGVDIINTLQT